MAKMVLLAATVSINSVDYSDHCSKIELTAEIEEKDVTTFASLGWKESLGGLGSGSLALTFKQDVADSNIDDDIWALFILRSPVTFVAKADDAAVGVNNPSYSGKVLLTQWKPVAGTVGDTAEVDITWPTSGAITRAES